MGIDRDRTNAVSAEADLASFVAEHYDRLVRLAQLVCRDGPDAGDAVQLGLEQAWRHRATLRDDARLRPWLDRIVVRQAIRIARSRQSWLGRIFTPRAGIVWMEPADPRTREVPGWDALVAAFQELSAEQRAVIALHLYMGYSVIETAELVGARVETVRSRLRLAKDRLRRQLEEPAE
jgi:RNA polymerase sigma-70 factor (ECF subfamily)